MRIKRFLHWFTGVLFVFVFKFSLAQVPHKSFKNVLFIAVDDLKPTLGCYGDKTAITPHMDYLSRKGTVFMNNHTQQAICSPSRISLLTGKRPDYTQVYDLKTKMRNKRPDILTIPQYFKQQGYTTAATGKIFDPRGVDKGADKISWSIPFVKAHQLSYLKPYGAPALGNYQNPKIRAQVRKISQTQEAKKASSQFKYVTQRYKPPVSMSDAPDEAYADGAIAKKAIELLDEMSKKNNPFFLAVGFKKPHLPFSAPKKYWDLYKREQMPLASFQEKAKGSPDVAYHKSGEMQSYKEPGRNYPVRNGLLDLDINFQKELIHGYYACVSFIDFQIGKLVTALQQRGLAEHTVIVIWGDHGWHLGDHSLWNKHSNFEQATRSPLIFIDSSNPKPTKVIAPTEFVDVFPTLCDLAGLAIPNGLDGLSLKPLMLREVNTVKVAAVSQYPRQQQMGYSFRSAQYRYTVWLKKGVKFNQVSGVSAIDSQELYDYTKDPLETINSVNDPKYGEIKAFFYDLAMSYFKTNQVPNIENVNESKGDKTIKALLKNEAFKKNGVRLGATLNHRQLNTPVAELFLKEFDFSTPENCAKQARIHPRPGVWDWTLLEDYLAFANRNNIDLRIHGPISPQASKWAKEDGRRPAELSKNMEEFFVALCKKINSEPRVLFMDVVNETITPEGEWFEEKPGTDLWENPWEQIGRDKADVPIYITKAFEWAGRYAPDKKFVFNQHGGMEPIMWEKVKETILYLKNKGLRVDGLGWQAHLRSNKKLAFSAKDLSYLSDLIDWTHQQGMSFHVTEFDYKIMSGKQDLKALKDQAAAYAAILKILLSKKEQGLVTWNCWGMVDGLKGKHHDKNRFLYDNNLQPKPAMYAIKKLLQNP